MIDPRLPATTTKNFQPAALQPQPGFKKNQPSGEGGQESSPTGFCADVFNQDSASVKQTMLDVEAERLKNQAQRRQILADFQSNFKAVRDPIAEGETSDLKDVGLGGPLSQPESSHPLGAGYIKPDNTFWNPNLSPLTQVDGVDGDVKGETVPASQSGSLRTDFVQPRSMPQDPTRGGALGGSPAERSGPLGAADCSRPDDTFRTSNWAPLIQIDTEQGKSPVEGTKWGLGQTEYEGLRNAFADIVRDYAG